MIRKLWILLLLGSISSCLYAQKQTANWYFGENAGLKFGECGDPPTAVSGQLNTKKDHSPFLMKWQLTLLYRWNNCI